MPWTKEQTHVYNLAYYRAKRLTPEAREKERAAAREYYRQHKDDVLVNKKLLYKERGKPKYSAKERQRRRAYMKKWRAANSSYLLQWRALNPYKDRSYVNARRARKLATSGQHSVSQWLARVEYHGWKCRYCKCVLTPKTLTIDHMIPLSRGGSDWSANLVPACKPCNSRKHDKTFKELIA